MAPAAGATALSNSPTAAPVADGGALLTAQLLRSAWALLIPSFGLTLLYLNLHFLVRYVAGVTTFVPFGAEWRAGSLSTAAASSALEYGELIALILLDVLAGIAALTIGLLIGLIAWAVAEPCAFLDAVGPTFAAFFGPGGLAVWVGCKIVG